MVPDHKLYLADLDSKEEAHFLCAYLNSHPVRTWLGGFLHGKQIGTSIFELMYVPRLQLDNSQHQRLVAISLESHKERAETRNAEPLCSELEEDPTRLVRRVASKSHKGA